MRTTSLADHLLVQLMRSFSRIDLEVLRVQGGGESADVTALNPVTAIRPCEPNLLVAAVPITEAEQAERRPSEARKPRTFNLGLSLPESGLIVSRIRSFVRSPLLPRTFRQTAQDPPSP